VGNCFVIKSDSEGIKGSYRVNMKGLGAGLKIAGELFEVNCILADNPAGIYIGPKIGLGIFGDLFGAVFIGPGLCTVGGGGIGLGFAVTADVLIISKMAQKK